jgi:CDGSH-type Zn-finger protein/uncharacterized Fe-S cluster protein YjdI
VSEKLHAFEGHDIRVTWSKARCIHAAECVRGLPRVFRPGERPWVSPEAGSAEGIAEVVMRCPTGALHFERTDGGPAEVPPARNTVEPTRGGPLVVRGDLEILRADGTLLLRDTRVALCRCGHSRNKPFCDGSHRETGFDDRGEVFEGGVKPGDAEFRDPHLRITPSADGPLLLAGPVTVRSADGRVALEGGKASLCRCGQSRNKPFCDGSHRGAGVGSG